MTLQDFMNAEAGMSRSKGVCMTMGTASTMSSLVEAMGLSLPTNAALPAVDSRRMALAHLTGKRIVEMVDEDIKPSDVLTKQAFINAIRANAAVGGSTNAVVHLLAIAGRVGVDLTLADFELGSDVPLLVNCMPSGKYLMEDFCYAGGMPVVLRELADQCLLEGAQTVLGRDISAYADGAECFNRDVIHSWGAPVKPAAGLRVLRGNLAPNGAIVKPSAATDALLEHEGEAYVFENIEELKATIDNDDLPVTKDTILVLKGCGPKGYPGMAEVGNMPIPRKLVREGVRDMIRVSDARMSGTAFGTVILHVSPEAQAGGTLALVKTGDRIKVSASQGILELLVDEAELAERRAAWTPDEPHYTRGYAKLYIDHVLQADQGADLDFLVGKDTRLVTRESH
jgi:dihydroxy-acid dehydratase